MLEYFENTYIGRLQRIGRPRRLARFPARLWNMHERVIAGLPRTNNSLEAWHNVFSKMVNISNPTRVRLAAKLRQEQHTQAIQRRQYQIGQPAPKRLPKYVTVDRALRTITLDFVNRQPLQFLTDIAQILQLQVA